MEFLTIVSLGLSIYAIVKIGKLESQLNRKSEIRKIEPITSQNSIITKVESQESTTDTVSRPGMIQNLIDWYAKDWPLKTGALFIFLGFIWLTTYAFLNNWIGPVGRITVCLIAGAAILYCGERRLRVVTSQGITLVALGAAVMVISIAAAQFLYTMFPSIVALALINMVMLLTAAISLRHKRLSLAIISLIIAGLAPVLVGSTERNIVALYSYLLAVTIGVIWLARYSRWRILLLLSLFITAIYSLSFFFGTARELMMTYTPFDVLMLRFFALTFITIYFLTTLASIINNKTATMIDLQSAVAVGFFTMAWINGLVSEEYKSFIIIAASLLFALAAYGVFIYTKLKQPVYAYSVVATVMLSVATAYAFDGPTLIIAFAIQACILPIVAVELFGAEIGKVMFIYFILPLLTSLPTLDSYSWQTGLLHHDFYALTATTLSFLFSGVYFYKKEKTSETSLHSISLAIVIAGGVYALVWIWKVFHAAIPQEYFARMMTLLIYTAIGLTAYLKGEYEKRKILYRFGVCVLGLVVVRLLLVEVWDMALPMRIITFFIVGLLFIGSVLLKKSGNQPSNQ